MSRPPYTTFTLCWQGSPVAVLKTGARRCRFGGGGAFSDARVLYVTRWDAFLTLRNWREARRMFPGYTIRRSRP